MKDVWYSSFLSFGGDDTVWVCVCVSGNCGVTRKDAQDS